MTETVDAHNDDLDGYLFRLWCRAGSYPGGHPGLLMKMFHEHGPQDGENMQPHHYRTALLAYAKATGANLPEDTP